MKLTFSLAGAQSVNNIIYMHIMLCTTCINVSYACLVQIHVVLLLNEIVEYIRVRGNKRTESR